MSEKALKCQRRVKESDSQPEPHPVGQRKRPLSPTRSKTPLRDSFLRNMKALKARQFFEDVRKLHSPDAPEMIGSALPNIKMALRCLEEIEPTIMHAKRRKIPNFNEQSERETQLSAARVALDSAITLLEPNA